MKASIASAILAYLAAVSAQGVTSIISAPGTAPSMCASSQNGVFGIQVVQAGSAFQKRAVSQIGDGQVQATSAGKATPVTQIGDGQIQATSAGKATPVTQIGDGQIQATSAGKATPVTQIGDGQIQATSAGRAAPVSQIGDGQIQAPSGMGMVTVTVTKNNCVASPITQISDGQIQAPMATPVTQISDGQIQAKPATATPVSQIRDGQVQAPSFISGKPVSQITDGQIQAKSGTTLATAVKPATTGTGMSTTTSSGYAVLPGYAQACASSGTLQISLKNGVLTDSKSRTGYVAANYQFQFDGPPQTGAIYTAGFSLCSNGTLALGSSSIFYQCLSGTFYNLYYYPSGHSIPAQCQAVQIEAIQLNQC